jgi:hypothetical protein
MAGVQVTRGAARSWRCRRGTAEAQHMVGEAAASVVKQRRGAEQVPEEEEEERRSEGPRWNLQKSQGLHCKQNFPTDPKL